MSVKLARTAGFCMGVRRAVDLVLDIAQRKGKEDIYTYGPLIHNPQTVELLKTRGIIPVRDLDEIDTVLDELDVLGLGGRGQRQKRHNCYEQERFHVISP